MEKIQSARDFACRFVPAQFERFREQLPRRGWLGGFALNVIDEGAWSFRVHAEQLVVEPRLDEERVLTASVSSADFSRLLSAIRPSTATPPAPLGLKALSWDAETVSLVRGLPGSVLLCLADHDEERRILLTPGKQPIGFEHATCRIECSWSDCLDALDGKQQPLELFLAGKIRLSGNADVALALAGLLL